MVIEAGAEVHHNIHGEEDEGRQRVRIRDVNLESNREGQDEDLETDSIDAVKAFTQSEMDVTQFTAIASHSIVACVASRG